MKGLRGWSRLAVFVLVLAQGTAGHVFAQQTLSSLYVAYNPSLVLVHASNPGRKLDLDLDFGEMQLVPTPEKLTLETTTSTPLYNQAVLRYKPRTFDDGAAFKLNTLKVISGVRHTVAGLSLDAGFKTDVPSRTLSSRASSDLVRHYGTLGVSKSIALKPASFLPLLNLHTAVTGAHNVANGADYLAVDLTSWTPITRSLFLSVTTSWYLQQGYRSISVEPSLTSRIGNWDVSFYGHTYSDESGGYGFTSLGFGGSLSRWF